MLTSVKEGPWKETIQRHIEWKKQLLVDLTTKQINTNLGRMIKQEEQEYFKVLGRNRFSRETTIEQELREIIKETSTGFCIKEIIPQVASLPRSECQPQTVGSKTNGLTTTFWVPVSVILTRPEVSFDEFEQGKGIVKLEGWEDPTQGDTLWFAEDEVDSQELKTWSSRSVTTS